MTTVGLSVYGMQPRDLLELSAAADRLGFDAVWLGEHVFAPVAYASAHPGAGSVQHHTGPIVALDTDLVDPWVAFGAVAAVTERLLMASGVYLLPLRHPLLTARAAVSAHDLSGGRLVLGVGAGWLEEEFLALGVDFRTRFSRLEETIEVLRALWAGGTVEHVGRHFRFPALQVTDHHVDVPIFLGGNGEKALARAARLGDGWFSSGTPSLEQALRLRDTLFAERDAAGRSGEYRCVFRVEHLDADLLDRYIAEGIEDLVLWADRTWVGPTLSHRDASLRRVAEELGLSDG